MSLREILDELYRHEINCGIQSFWDGGWTVWLGDEQNGRKEEATIDAVDDIGKWLLDTAKKHYPNCELQAACGYGQSTGLNSSLTGWSFK